VFLLLFSTLVDYVFALQIEKSKQKQARKLYLLSSLSINLGLLIFFKYADFFGENIASLANLLGLKASWTTLHLVLPLGISFYTFQTISYTLDVYRGRLKAEKSWVNVALYVSFFPQLIAGPIERARDLLPQFNQLTCKFSPEAIFWITLGFFKKMVVADNLAPFVDKVFYPTAQATAIEYLWGMYAFAVQIYADFSGYSDIAIGIALLLGVKLHQNFQQPYFSASFQEFWRRWHMSLSFWLRDYVYISLGGSQSERNQTLYTYRNLLITMTLGGLWHGANWTFVCWGLLHGLLLVSERAWLSFTIDYPVWKFLKKCWIFHWVALAFVIFRAQSVPHAIDFIQRAGEGLRHFLTTFDITSLPKVGGVFALVLFVVDIALSKRWLIPQANTDERYWLRWVVLMALFWAIMLFGMFQGAQFIYFQF
jgi:D-alanyl-lipoteichoic acid acyltransferase DltB (MBOAT superfamily)